MSMSSFCTASARTTSTKHIVAPTPAQINATKNLRIFPHFQRLINPIAESQYFGIETPF